MTTLARLSCWIEPERENDFVAVFAQQLLPLLKEHGLGAAIAPDRPTAKGVFSRLFAVECPDAVAVLDRALRQDETWQVTLGALGPHFGRLAAATPIRTHFEIYRTPAGAGQTVPAGPGSRQGSWHSFGVQDGLPYHLVDLLQDRNGQLWWATGWHCDPGLCRFDGFAFTFFTRSDGLAHDRVFALLEDRQGHLWVATQDGLSRFDGRQFETFGPADGLGHGTVWCLLEERAGQLWCGTEDGLSCFDGTEWRTYTTADGLAHPCVGALAEDRQGSLWVGTGRPVLAMLDPPGAGLSRFDGRNWRTYTTADGLGSDTVLSLWVDDRDILWVGTNEGGLCRFDGTQFASVEALGSNSVTAIRADATGALWCATHTNGLFRFDGRTWVPFTTDDGLANNQILGLATDDQQQLWVGTFTGVSRYDEPHFSSFTRTDGLVHNGVMSLLEDRAGQLWIGTFEGVCRWDGTRFIALEALAAWHVWSMLEDRQGNLWFGCAYGAGVCRYDGVRFIYFTTEDGLAANRVWSMLEDRQGQLWFGTAGGVSRWDGRDFTTCTTADGLLHNDVTGLLEDRQGHLWFATSEGVSRYDGSTFTTFNIEDGLAHNQVRALLEDRQGQLWFGTSEGVSRYDGSTFTTFTAAQSLAPGWVQALLEDRQGHLWFATTGGVSRYDGQVFQTLTRRDGLVFDVTQVLLQDRSGAILIGTEGGLTRYRPAAKPPQVRLQAVIADRRYAPTENLQIPVSQKLVVFEFQGRSLTTRAEGMAYVYRLAGHQADWQPAYTGRVEYHDLPLGPYTFQVKAVDRDLNYSEPASVGLKVAPDPHLEGLTEALSSSGPTGEFVGQSPALLRVLQQLAQVAPTDATVLVLGETGTGKGLAARTLHALSGRKKGPFITVSCGALPETLVESELFGHEQGAFTGATHRKLGKVELADQGTLLLDEIGDLPPAAQAKLLRLLEERTFERVGGTQERQTKARIVAATNRDLAQMVAQGTFRADLFFRLQGFEVQLPPLRARREDISLLALYFLTRSAAHLDKREIAQLSPEALARLQAHDWPGNVRELEHVVRRAVIVGNGPTLRVGDIALGSDTTTGPIPEEVVSLQEHERRYIQQVLERTGGVIRGPGGAAQLLNIPPSTLYGRMKKLGIERP